MPRRPAPKPAVSRADGADALRPFQPATRAWFESAFEAPTAAQAQGWPSIARGEHTLICAPTGSGKTLAAFLWCLDRLLREPVPRPPLEALRVLYVSPLKALAHDVDRNLRAPLHGIALAAQARSEATPPIRVGIRTGDTPAAERTRMTKAPPDIMVTTPESLYLMLTSAARESLRSVEWVIVDEIHALAGTKRGAHLALSLERLTALAGHEPQRIGLSATQRPLSAVAAYLGGRSSGGDGAAAGPARPVTIVDAGVRKALELQVVVPVEDMSRLGEANPLEEAPAGPGGRDEARISIWPSVYPRILELIRAHRSTIVFTNSRRLAERLALKLNELAGEDLVRAHHGSVAREQRLEIEAALKEGRLPGIVATSSLELGIDMGAVDLVIQVEAPTSVASGLQRIGRAGHQVGEPSRGVIFPKFRGDLVEAAVVVRRMHEGAIETTRVPRNPLDVLAQQLVATTADRAWPIDDLFALVRRAENYAELGRESFESVVGMLAGDYPSDEFAELRPRLVWDRLAGTVQARRDARTVALTSGGTIPDRGLFGVYLADDGDRATTRARDGRRVGGRRVGELDEEMVYEAREGEVILLGASAWRIERITHDRVLVSPAPGEPGKIPFWKGDAMGRPVELGRALGAFVRETSVAAAGSRRDRAAVLTRLRRDHDLDGRAAANLLAYLAEEREATGALPTDRTIVIERFRDELGDWRVCLLSPFGGRVHAPWALAIEARLREARGLEVATLWSDDGIVLRLPATEDPLLRPLDPGADGLGFDADGPLGSAAVEAAEAAVRIAPDEVEDLVVGALGGSTLYAARFRENAARALLLPRRRGTERRPLWQMRQRSAQLLEIASRYGSFPIVLETYRECLQDIFDLPALREILGAIERREVDIVSVETSRASPFASSLLFDYVATYMYEGDAPLVDRRAQALALDRDLLRELLGAEELRELLDAEAIGEVELELQSLTEERAAASADAVHDLLRRLGDLSADEVAARVRGDDSGARARAAGAWLEVLVADRRAVPIRVAGEARWIASEDAGRYRDAVGSALPSGIADAHLGPAPDALERLLGRWARRHGPFSAAEPASRWGLPAGIVESALERLMAGGTLLRGEFRPGGVERDWCDPEVLRLLRRRSLARLRHEVEPVDGPAYARFLIGWQGVGARGRGGPGRLAEVVAQLEGLALPASALEREILPARVPGYQPRLLDELGAAGEVCWVGQGSLGRDDGRIALFRPDRLGLVSSWVAEAAGAGVADPAGQPDWPAGALLAHLERRGASFYRDLQAAVAGAARDAERPAPSQRELLDAIWSLAWAGLVTNDTFAPLRALRWGRRGGRSDRPPRGGLHGGPPEAAGRWSLVSEARQTSVALAGRPVSPTEARHGLAMRLLERQGIVTRDGVVAEGIAGGYGAVYGILRELEERGRVRRGYFVEGLGGAQFGVPGAVDRLRAARLVGQGGRLPDDSSSAVVLAATDPASPWGAALPWPRRGDADRRPLARAAGAAVVLVDGSPVCFLERGGRSLLTLPAADDPELLARALSALAADVLEGRRPSLEIQRIDGMPSASAPLAEALAAAGFRASYRGLLLRSTVTR